MEKERGEEGKGREGGERRKRKREERGSVVVMSGSVNFLKTILNIF